ncbi:MAG: hypothetical protein RLZZ458_2563 [Planctomycetota bacterium]
MLGDEFVVEGGVVGGDEDAVLLGEEFRGQRGALHWWEVVVPHFGECGDVGVAIGQGGSAVEE